MPMQDGTGPVGTGPIGRRGRFYGCPYARITPTQEKEMLEQDLQDIKKRLEEIKNAKAT